MSIGLIIGIVWLAFGLGFITGGTIVSSVEDDPFDQAEA